ncbi:MAG: response regulator [Gammaproteobacteria bacterium]|nr:MAG: response regulator [Gammaproteobacteria bacterium]
MEDNKQPTMMIAEDENIIRMLLKAVAKETGFEVVAEAENGREAVDIFRVVKPDITLMDINMPKLTGLEALEKIHETNPGACVIMLTSVADMDSVRKAIDLGAANYILKDTPVEEIEEMIRDTWTLHCGTLEENP